MPRTPGSSFASIALRAIARTRFVVALLIVVAPAWTSCGGDKVTPTSPTTTVVSPTVKSVAINGPKTVALTSIGETMQLTATAILSDGTSKDVTKNGTWQSGAQGIVTIDQNGVLTAVGFGATSISFTYQTLGSGRSVTVTPAGTFVIAGRVREPGVGGLANVSVVETISGRSIATGTGGEFSVAELTRRDAHFKFERAGYEPAEMDAVADVYADLAVQRIVRVVAGEVAAALPLAPNDLRYTVDGNTCVDCRMIRVVVPQAGIVHVRVTWANSTPRLTLFAGGQVFKPTTTRELIADVPVSAPDETLMYLGAAPPDAVMNHTPFVFETSLR